MNQYWEETDSYMFVEKMQQYKLAKDLELKKTVVSKIAKIWSKFEFSTKIENFQHSK